MHWRDVLPFFRPRWDWVQVEVTTWCQAACIYCPRTVYRERWESRHLSLDTFHRLLPHLAQAGLVYLQGWGEPLLHPDFFEMAALARRAGCRVGTTTNGMELDEGKIQGLVDVGLDLAAFSLAGTDEKQDAIRRGTRLSEVIEAIRRLQTVKAQRGSARPEVHLAYMLLRSGLKDLKRLPLLLQDLGLSQVVISTLDFVACRELAREALRPAEAREYATLQAQLEEVAEAGSRVGLRIFHHLPHPTRGRGGCPENIPRSLVVAADGRVTPCVFANLSVSGLTHFRRGCEHPYENLSFGNINEQPLPDIWRQRAYVDFRQAFGPGKMPGYCRGCPKL